MIDHKFIFRLTALTLGVMGGLLIAWLDSRPHWDDAGITACLILGTTWLLGALIPRQAWLAAIAVGIWVPLHEVISQGNWGSLLALAIAFAGAYSGNLTSKWVHHQLKKQLR